MTSHAAVVLFGNRAEHSQPTTVSSSQLCPRQLSLCACAGNQRESLSFFSSHYLCHFYICLCAFEFRFTSVFLFGIFMFTDSFQPYQRCGKLLLIQTEHFWVCLLHIKGFLLAKKRDAFIMKKLEEVKCLSSKDSPS